MQEHQEHEALKRGKADVTTTADVSIMAYYTPDFRNDFLDPVCEIKRLIGIANDVMRNSNIPVHLHLFCIQELNGFYEDLDWQKRLDDFWLAKTNFTTTSNEITLDHIRQDSYIEAYKQLLNTADMALLFTGTNVRFYLREKT